MPTSTRSSNKNASFKVYYSRKAAPKQRYFPHRRKTVRRPDPQDDGGKKQLRFLPELMRRSTVQDSDEDDVETEEMGEDVVHEQEVRDKRKGTKRTSDVMHEGIGEHDDEPVRPTSTRRRKAALPKRRRVSAPIEPVSDDGETETIEPGEVPKPRLRRQSTMTQMVDGRIPSPGSAEPEFKRVKRIPRTSWGSKRSKKDAEKDKKQRTLTQMVHGLTPLVLDSDEELENQIESDDEVDAAHRDFLFGNNEAEASHPTPAEDHNEENIPALAELPKTVDDDDGDGDEDEYQPTQYIEAPTKRRRTPLRSSTRRQPTPAVIKSSKPLPGKSSKTRFGLLSTPEKRGVFEVASSQSPPDSPLSTQTTPRTLGRTPLNPCSANASKPATSPLRVVETPSKRKQVTFQEGSQEQIPPPKLRKFASTIPDSDDEAGDLTDSDVQSDVEYNVGEETQALLRKVDGPFTGASVGAETQAMLLDIDQACANSSKDAAWVAREESEELGEPLDTRDNEVSQELGHEPLPHTSASTEGPCPDAAELPPLPFSSPKPMGASSANAEAAAAAETRSSPPVMQMGSSPPVGDYRTQPPTPMFDDESPEEAGELTTTAAANQLPTATRQIKSSPPIEDFRTQSPTRMFNDETTPEDVDLPVAASPSPRNRTVHTIQVPRSPPTHLKIEPSHSSQAELQLQFEYQNYSQYRPPGPQASSMHVAHDSGYSYQATPFPPRHPTQNTGRSDHISQATTVDPTQISPNVTPRKRKPHAFTRSATTTPQKNLMSSPEASKPPPLFIPSSFPSPARVAMEGWSSPVMGRGADESQWGVGSLVDFSIPAPPPGEWIDDDEEEGHGR